MKRIILLLTAATMLAVLVSMSVSPVSANILDNDDNVFFSFGDNDDSGLGFDDQELESGDIETETDISIEGNNNNQCVGVVQFGNTGNFANQQGTTQDGSEGFFVEDDDNFFFGNDNGEFEQEFE